MIPRLIVHTAERIKGFEAFWKSVGWMHGWWQSRVLVTQVWLFKGLENHPNPPPATITRF